MDLFDIAARITLNTSDYEKGLENVEGRGRSFSEKIKTGFGTAAKIGGEAVASFVQISSAAIGSGIIAAAGIAKKATESYADYEQLVGGVETLFEGSADTILNYAEKAYQTAGVSANAYLEMVTSTAGSMIQSTGKVEQQNIEMLQSALDEELLMTKRTLQDELNATKKYWDDRIKEAQNSKTENTKEAKEAKNNAIALLKEQRDAELTAIKRSNEDKLSEMKAYHKEQIAAAQAANSQSIKSEESLKKAAELSNMALMDMSDNANKMGTALESIQAAYAGFSKQNYTMLDNLKLGYGGTKEEMERLLADAERISGVKYDISSYADLVSAIHVVQTEMNITGTTAKEASSTIAGSGAAAKAAWENLLTSLASGDKIEESVENFTSSIATYAENLVPVFTKALSGIGMAIKKIAPIIAKELPKLAKDLIPAALEAGISVATAMAEAFPELIPMIVSIINDNLDGLIDAAFLMIETIGGAIIENLPTIGQAALDIIMKLIEHLTSDNNLQNFIQAAFTMIKELAMALGQALPELIPAAVSVVLQIVESLLDNMDMLIDAAISLITGLAEGIVNAIPILIKKVPVIITKLVQGIIRNAPKMFEAAKEIVSMLGEGISQLWDAIKSWGSGIIDNIKNGIVSTWNDVKTWGRSIIDKVWSGLKGAINDAKTWGKDLIKNFWNGIKSNLDWLWSGIKSIGQGIADFLGFSEPKKGPLSNFHTFAPDMMQLFMKGINDNKDKLTDTVANAFNFRDLVEAPEGIDQYGHGSFGSEANQSDRPIYLVLDSGELVGKIVGKMDRALGVENSMTLRWRGSK